MKTGENDDAGRHAAVRTGRRQPQDHRPRDLAYGHPPDDPNRLPAGAMEARPGARGAGGAPGPGHAAARRNPGLAAGISAAWWRPSCRGLACSSRCCWPGRCGAAPPPHWLALVLPAVVWLHLFGGVLSDKSHPGGFLTVASENVNAGNPDPAGTARDLAASGADVLALVELTPQVRGHVREGAGQGVPVPRGPGHGRAVEQAATVGHPTDRHHGLRAAGGHHPGRQEDGLEPGAADHGGHGPRAADGLCGPPGVRTGESQGGLLDGLARHRRAGARPGHRRRSESSGCCCSAT